MKATRENMLQYAEKQYDTAGERLWERYPEHVVLRHPCGKWYAIIMNVSSALLGKIGGKADIMVVKCSPNEREELLLRPGFMPAYHMNKSSWITLVLGKVDYGAACKALDNAYLLAPQTKRKTRSDPKCFILPFNPEVCGVKADFASAGEAEWVQKGSLICGDRLYLYLPASGVAYACDVVSALPEMRGGKAYSRVKVKPVREYKPPVPLSVLKEHGILRLSGMRGVPYGLQFELENNY